MNPQINTPSNSPQTVGLTAKQTLNTWRKVALILTLRIINLENEIRCLKKVKPMRQSKKSADYNAVKASHGYLPQTTSIMMRRHKPAAVPQAMKCGEAV